MWWLWGAVAGASEPACADREALLEAYEVAAFVGNMAAAHATRAEILDALSCGRLAEPEWMARLWLVEALMLNTEGQVELRDQALDAAIRTSPDYWNDDYGPVWRDWWDAVRQRPTPGSGALHFVPSLPDAFGAAIDGYWYTDPPMHVLGGYHVVQIGVGRRDLVAASVVHVPDAGTVDVRWSIPPVNLHRARPNRRIRDALIVGGVGAMLYGTTVATRSVYVRQLPDAPPGLRTANNAMVVGAAGLATLSAVLFARGAVSPGSQEAVH